MANTVDTTEGRIGTIVQESENREMTKAEICFGAMMAIGAIAGMWGAVSLMISYFMG